MNNSKTSVIPYASGHSRAQLLIFLFVGCIVIDLIAVGSYCSQIGLLSRVAAGDWVAPAKIAANIKWQDGIAGWQMLASLITAIVFLMWIHRAHRNLPALGVRNLKYSPGWAVGGFFVPFLNLVRPYQVVKEIWKASDPHLKDESSWERVAASPLFGWWWAFFLISNFLGRIGGRMASDLLAMNWAWLSSDLISIVAGILAILVVRGIDARQEEKSKWLINEKTSSAPSGNEITRNTKHSQAGVQDHGDTTVVTPKNPSTQPDQYELYSHEKEISEKILRGEFETRICEKCRAKHYVSSHAGQSRYLCPACSGHEVPGFEAYQYGYPYAKITPSGPTIAKETDHLVENEAGEEGEDAFDVEYQVVEGERKTLELEQDHTSEVRQPEGDSTEDAETLRREIEKLKLEKEKYRLKLEIQEMESRLRNAGSGPHENEMKP